MMDKTISSHRILVVFLFIYRACYGEYSCSGFNGNGYTYPVGDIIIEYNTSTPLEITCVIKDKTLIQNDPDISSKLYFKQEALNVSSDKIEILNQTSIKFTEEYPEKMCMFYYCMLENTTVCLNNVCVGTKPQPVTDFKCIGRNYENLTCSWTRTQNFVYTSYYLSYTAPKTRPGKRISNCTITQDAKTKTSKCFWGLNTNPHYRQSLDYYNFTLKSENRFGSLEQIFLFDHMKNILAEPPENLSCKNSTTSSLNLFWKIPWPLAPISVGLQHRILYQCSYGPKIWQSGGIIETKPSDTNVTFNLTGLRHAHDVCDIRVAIRVKGADSEEMWSANSSITALTSSTIPGESPKVNVGSFQTEISVDVRDIYVYWQQVPMETRNAENFHYVVTVDDCNSDDCTKISTNSFARFDKMQLHSSYKFTIWSKNSEGVSKESASLMVPAIETMISEPVSFTKVYFENGLYKLSWEPPAKGAEFIENYTIFRCKYDRDRPYQCKGHLNWIEVPSTTTEYNITVSERSTTQFAISANNATSSSGMVWATCTLIHNKLITKMKEVWIANVGSTYIEVKWKLDCADRSDSVSGYVIYYCQVTKQPACLKQMNITINNPYANSGIVTGLNPYTTYMLMVSVTNKQGSQSPESDKLYNTTYEAAPSEPLYLKDTEVTNSTITITWKRPEKLNGYLRRYNVYFNDRMENTPDNRTTYVLSHLHPDLSYNISVSACTSLCSNRSKTILVKTKIGHPGQILSIWETRENNTLIVHWSKPDGRRRNNLYEVNARYDNSNENMTLPMITVSENSYSLINCEDDTSTYHVSVRAVNIDNNNVTYKGPWTKEYEASCDRNTNNSSLIWMGVVVSSLFLIFIMSFSGKRLYVYYTDMKTIDVKMPPGLDPQIESNWPQPKLPVSPSDEEHLLHKNFISNGGDSSGCSSGQESVSSDSGSSITSTSDSGTEQPRTPSDEDPKELLMNIDALKLDNQSYVQFPWNSSSSNSNGYSMYGISDSSVSEMELVGVPTSKSNVESSYTTCDQFVGIGEPSSNNSYVPLSNSQDKSSSYVMAANKTAVMSNLLYHSPAPDEKSYVQVSDVSGVPKSNNAVAGTSHVSNDEF